MHAADLAQAPTNTLGEEARKKPRALEKAIIASAVLVFSTGLFLRVQGLLMFGETINEYDPWFNFRCSSYIREYGMGAFFRWRDGNTWAPRGRSVGHTTYPGLMVASNGLHFLLDLIFPFSYTHYQICSVVPVFCFLASSFVLWHMGRHMRSPLGPLGTEKQAVSLALFSVCGGHLEKTISGAFDYEGLSVLCTLCTLFAYGWASTRMQSQNTAYTQYINTTKSGNSNSTDANENKEGPRNNKNNEGTNNNNENSTTNENSNEDISNNITNEHTNSSEYTARNNATEDNTAHNNTYNTNPNTIRNRSAYKQRTGRVAVGYGCLVGVLQSAFATVWGGSPITAALIASFEVLRLGSPVFLAAVAVVLLLARVIFPFTSPFGLDVISLFGASVMCTLIRWILLNPRSVARGLLVSTCVFLGAVAALWKAKSHALIILQQSKAYNLLLGQSTHPVVQSVAEHQSPSLDTFMLLFGPVGYLYIPFLLVYFCCALRRPYARVPGKSHGNSMHLVVAGAGLAFLGLFLWMERFAPFFAPFLALVASDVLVECIMYAKSHIAARYLVRIFASALLLVHVAASLVFASGLLIDGVVIIQTASNGALIDDFREAAAYMKHNSDPNCTVISWWDYGYQITGMTGRRTVVDNNTNDYARISEVAALLLSPEEKAGSAQIVSEIIQSYDCPIYFYVVCGHMSQYPHSDMHKSSWILRISEESRNPPGILEYYYGFRGTKQRFLGALDAADHTTGKLNGERISISRTLRNSLLYKLSYYQYDPGIELASTELFYQTRHHIVRIYRLK